MFIHLLLLLILFSSIIAFSICGFYEEMLLSTSLSLMSFINHYGLCCLIFLITLSSSVSVYYTFKLAFSTYINNIWLTFLSFSYLSVKIEYLYILLYSVKIYLVKAFIFCQNSTKYLEYYLNLVKNMYLYVYSYQYIAYDNSSILYINDDKAVIDCDLSSYLPPKNAYSKMRVFKDTNKEVYYPLWETDDFISGVWLARYINKSLLINNDLLIKKGRAMWAHFYHLRSIGKL